jgi:hypothetical protein
MEIKKRYRQLHGGPEIIGDIVIIIFMEMQFYGQP